METKAQIRMTETVAVLFIFFILVMFGVIFYYKYQQVAFAEKQEELLAARAIDTTLKTIFLPELICGKGEAEAENYCFDLLKLRSIDNVFKKHIDDYYSEIFSYATIEVQQLYPRENSWVIYNRVKPGFTTAEPTYFVVALRDDIAGEMEAQYSFGYVKVTVYS